MTFRLRTLINLFLALTLALTPLSVFAEKKSVNGVTHKKTKQFTTSKKNKHLVRTQGRKSVRSRRDYQVDHYDGSTPLSLSSEKAIVVDQNSGEIVYSKNMNVPTPVASVTKLMTAMVVIDAQLDMDVLVAISDQDVDYIKGTSSRLSLGTLLSREELLNLALIASENRAASALASSYPGGQHKFVQAMNAKARSLGMYDTHFVDSTGLDSNNISTAVDLAKMVHLAHQYPIIRQITTSPSYTLFLPDRATPMTFKNTNILVRNLTEDWDIGLSKTGYISEAGRCLVMQSTIAGVPLILVLLDSDGKFTRIGDANRVRKWVEHQRHKMVTAQLPGTFVTYN